MAQTYECEKCGHRGKVKSHNPKILKALTVRGVWGYAILHLGKRIENRNDRWHSIIGQWVAIHFSSKMNIEGMSDDGSCMKIQMMALERGLRLDIMPHDIQSYLGKIVALAHVSGIRDPLTSDETAEIEQDWHDPRRFGLEFDELIELNVHVPARGNFGLWNVGPEEHRRIVEDEAVRKRFPEKTGPRAA